jgi:pilus assembly protein Flp/PilA
MKNLLNTVSNFLRDEEGLTMVEYAIAGAIIAVGVATAFGTITGAVGTAADNISDAVDNAGTAASG